MRRPVSTVALVLALLSVLAFRMAPAVPHLHVVDLVAYVAPQLLAALGAAGALRSIGRRGGLGDGVLQSIAVLLGGLGAFELVGLALDATHAVGVHGLVAHGGWAAVPVALGLGAALGLLACAVTVGIRGRASAPPPGRPRRAVGGVRSTGPVLVPSSALIARNLAGRAPPALSR